MEGLVEGLVGAKVGETKAVQVNFPEKLRDKSLAGKRAIFDVEVLEASERQVPEVTDEFANQVKAGLTAETLLAELRKAIDAEDAKEFTPARNKALGQALADVMDMQVPDTLVSNQAREKFAVMMSEMRDSGVSDEEIKRQINPENFAKYKEIVKDDIIKDFKVSIAADEIGRLENVQVPDYQVEEQMEAIRKDAAESKQELDENMIRGKVEATLQRQAVFDWLAERSQLQVEFEDDYFDEALMEKLAKESLEREEQIAAGKAATPESGKLEPVGVEAPAAVDAAVEENVVPVPAETEPEPKAEKKEDETVVETTAPEPVPEEEQKDPVVAETTEDEEAKKERYASMTLEDRAFAILQDIGLAGGDETTTKK
jgi:trigger factor